MPATAEVPVGRQAPTTEEHNGDQRTGIVRARYKPLLAICGLAGGAGATTLAYLVALTAAQQSPDPVLLADTGGPSGALAACAGVETAHTLPELASQLAAGRPLADGLWASGPAGARVLASAPEFTSTCTAEPLTRLLLHAREAHGLTVIDCGTLAAEADRVAAAAATHLAWVIPATGRCLDRCRRVLAAAPFMPGRELVVARAEAPRPRAPLRELRRLADERRAPLVLMPHLGDVDAARPERAVEPAQVAIQAILGALRR